MVLGSHRQVSAAVVSSSIKYKYTSTGTIYTPKDICSDMLHTFGIYLNYSKVWRSREQTLKMIRGDPTESFGKIPSFFCMLRQRNPSTVTELEIDSHNRFKPEILVDDTYLNGHYRGTIFTRRIVFCIRPYGSIKKVIEQVYPGSCHVICSCHLLQNLKSYYGKSGQDIMHAFNLAVRAYTLEEFEYNMQQLDAMNGKIRDYLDEVDPEKWLRIHMPANKYSTMTPNIIESVNAITKVSPSNQTVFFVSDERSTFVVDVEQRTCTCRMLQVDLMLCPRALAVIAHTKRDLYAYYSYYYTRDAYVNAYVSSVYLVGNPDEWRVPDEVELQIVLAPNC
ncbi:uncharacterized protein LOC111397964 [Olea europaea var. sylvestris]|uniref:uncharacterized protein LOC111397964 n=1 Tax=Olea europaea var. sylvestris TaxID=158386 RepID=UPI000C1CCFDD|nr:uncharacterized protein LOC111397964 [Olea europaea var. sylvestris]